MNAVGQSGTGPLPAEQVLGAAPVHKEPRLLGGRLFWLEQLPAQRGRTTLRLRTRRGAELELTPDLDLRSRIHGYGGGVYALAGGTSITGSPLSDSLVGGATGSAPGPGGTGAEEMGAGASLPEGLATGEIPAGATAGGSDAAAQTVVVVAEGGRSLWRLDLPGDLDDAPAIAPVRLTPAADSDQRAQEAPQFGDGVIDPERQRWIGVCEQNGRDRLVTVPLAGGTPRVLWESPGFCGYAVLGPSGRHLAWVSWQQPCMPWDRSLLWLGRFDASGDLVEARAIAGSAPDDAQAISVFQPLWAGPDLVVANDRSGWWNLELLENAETLATETAPAWRPLLPMRAEFAMPQWVYGMRTTAWDGRLLLAAACRDGRWELGALLPSGNAAAAATLAPAGDALNAGDSNHPCARSTPAPATADGPETTGTPGIGATASVGRGSESLRRAERASARAETAEPRVANVPTGSCDRESPCGPGNAVAASGAASPAPALRGPLHWQPIPLPFDDLAALDAEDGTLVALASGPVHGPGLLELKLLDPGRLESGAAAPLDAATDGMPLRVGSRPGETPLAWTHRPAAAALLAPEQISRPEPLWFSGHGGLPTHAWYYPPRGGASPVSPLLVRGHSGPTAMARTGLSLAIQFWTSRGWGVVDVNYGGSTGFGRAYRERLDGGWGVVDVDDCLAAARALVASGRAAPERIAMEGSSASGFTVLAAMARDDTLRAGAIRYPVTDLTALAECDHRFEARYFDALVGPWPSARSVYEERSPLRQAERINAPLLFFHGLEDGVVPAEQSIAMVERLQARGVPVELLLFEGEGHGFRDGAVQRQVLERSEAFFRERFGLGEAG